VVLLDVQFTTSGQDLAYTYTGVKGFVPQEELDWLRADLAATTSPTIVCVHQRLDAEREEWRDVGNAEEVRAILAASGVVVAVFQGHDHENAHAESDGIHYLTFEALVDQGTPPSWARVTIDPEARTIRIEGEGDQTDWDLTY
jgi:alkaline phosphatase